MSSDISELCSDISLNYEVIRHDGETTEIMNCFALRKSGEAENPSATLPT